MLAHTALVNEIVRELITVAERDHMHLQLYRNDEYYCEARNRFSELYACDVDDAAGRRALPEGSFRV